MMKIIYNVNKNIQLTSRNVGLIMYIMHYLQYFVHKKQYHSHRVQILKSLKQHTAILIIIDRYF